MNAPNIKAQPQQIANAGLAKFGAGCPPLSARTNFGDIIRSGAVLGGLKASAKGIHESVAILTKLTQIEKNGGNLDDKSIPQVAENLVRRSQDALAKLVELGKMSGLSASVMSAAIKTGADVVMCKIANTVNAAPLSDIDKKLALVKQAKFIEEKLAQAIQEMKQAQSLKNAQKNTQHDREPPRFQ